MSSVKLMFEMSRQQLWFAFLWQWKYFLVMTFQQKDFYDLISLISTQLILSMSVLHSYFDHKLN